MRKYRFGITYWLAALFVVFVTGCGQEVVTVPAVVSTIPANGATNVSVSTPISATFSMAMNAASLTTTTFTVTGPGGAVAGAVTYSGVTATFTPAAVLANGTVYTGTITTGAKDVGGTPLLASYVWTFTTITPPPVVTATVPVNGATGVPINQVLSATFNEAMSCATLASPAAAFTVTGPGATTVAGTVSCSGAVATFTPTANLAVNTVYTATITTGAQDLAGTPLAANFVWTFRTVPAPTPPIVISTVPVNLATAVPINQALSATFSVAMTPSTIDTATFTLRGPGGASVTGAVTYVAAGSVATFTPAANLASSTVYTATITTGATDLQGTALANNYVWIFTTAAAVIGTPPAVNSTVPADGATSVPLNQIVSATFSEAMNPATINSTTFTLMGPGTTAVAGLVAYAAIGNTLTFTPTANLAPSTLFTATITTGATNLTGNPLATNYVWTFTTGTTVDTTPPQLVSTVPVNTAADVPLNQAVSAIFSEAMNPLTITTGTFTLTGPGGTAIAGTVSYDAINFIATFTPTAPLIASTIYTATVSNGVTNLAGVALGTTGAPNPWTFTTGTAVVVPPVVLGPTISLFGGFGGGAGLTNQGTQSVINGDIGTTGVSTLITGFHDTSVMVGSVAECTYTETPLNIALVNGTIDTAPPPPTVGCPNEGTAVTFAIATEAALEALTAYNTLAAIPNGLDVSVCPGCGGGTAGELGNRTLAPGVYKSAADSYGITLGDLTLDAKGDPNASWVFQMGTSLTVGTPSAHRSVLLVNGAQAKNVFWQVGSATAINGVLGGGTMQGTIISKAGISVSTAGVAAITTINGRLLDLDASVTIVNTVINVP
ncbi:Ig-like domain-containing protein [Acidicapsa acidisoli]|uniref:Ig-like domain-containing protein n=1 Tax=Acidicapsa acidisoli TaxID=1615681 RepID=UPI0021E08F53|nr:Ig-like domain-containing protein [Acidicapsa acidisoli]